MVANGVLLSWPLVVLVFFAAMGREKGLIWSVILGYLILPENLAFALPGLPDYNKTLAISLSVLLGALFFGRRRSWPELPNAVRLQKNTFNLALKGLFVLTLVGVVVTVTGNGYPLIDVDRVRSALGIRDIISGFSGNMIMAMPFFLAWRWLTAPRHHQEVLRVLVIMGVIYSVLAFYEMRMSPHINRTVYGFFPHDWLQHVRGGQFRPVVFLQHGLWLALFLLMASFSAFGLFRSMKESRVRILYLLAGLWILAVLFLSPNLGASILVIFVPAMLFVSRKAQARIITVVAVIFLVFPAMRQNNMLPLNGLLSAIESVAPARAASFAFRLENEDDMLSRAAKKPMFGWGGWGRWRVIDEKGRDTTVSDGLWIIVLGTYGWVGYVAYFGFLTFGLLVMSRVARDREVDQVTLSIGLIMAANLVYLVPNSALSPVGWLLCGALAGFVTSKAVYTTDEVESVPSSSRIPRYSRFGPSDAPAPPLVPTSRTSKYSKG